MPRVRIAVVVMVLLVASPVAAGDDPFRATWCPPCKEEMPSMERLYRRYKERGFAILAVSIDTGGEAIVRDFVKRHGPRS